MGDPKKNRKQYDTPAHPWKKGRLEEEGQFKRSYGLKNKKEVWRVQTLVRHLRARARGLISARDEHSKRLEGELMAKSFKLGFVGEEATMDDILALTPENVLDRRLQTVVYKKGFAQTIKQARQFITHGHVTLRGKRITTPGYLVLRDEESLISFYTSSSLAAPDHPERVIRTQQETSEPEEVTANER